MANNQIPTGSTSTAIFLVYSQILRKKMKKKNARREKDYINIIQNTFSFSFFFLTCFLDCQRLRRRSHLVSLAIRGFLTPRRETSHCELCERVSKRYIKKIKILYSELYKLVIVMRLLMTD